jgi:hypothetical protein
LRSLGYNIDYSYNKDGQIEVNENEVRQAQSEVD